MPENVRNASYYFGKWMRGEDMPAVGEPNEPPYDAFAGDSHRGLAQAIVSGGMDPVRNPKPPSLSENLIGNQQPVAFDSTNMRLGGIASRDPRFLKTWLRGSDGVPMNPREMFNSGDLTMEEALKHPTYWDDAPRKNEYGALEDFSQDIAGELGMTPAQFQTSVYLGKPNLTGYASHPTMTFLDNVLARVLKTAKVRGITPAQALIEHMIGVRPLAGVVPLAFGTLNEASDSQSRHPVVGGPYRAQAPDDGQ
jgi:hypothetical protein